VVNHEPLIGMAVDKLNCLGEVSLKNQDVVLQAKVF